MREELKITKGQIIAVTEGEYSDYGVEGHLHALDDFVMGEMVKEFKASDKYLERPDYCEPTEEPDESLWSNGSIGRFLA